MTAKMTYTSSTVKKTVEEEVDGKKAQSIREVYAFDVTIYTMLGPITLSIETDHSDATFARSEAAGKLRAVGTEIARLFDNPAPFYDGQQS